MNEKLLYPYRHLQIHYHKIGRGKPLLILHGWGSSAQLMIPLARQLADFRTCYVIDLPGFGDTDEPPVAWNIDDYTNLIEAFMRDTFNEPADLLAHSFGGRITLKLCARPSDRDLIGKVLITGGAGMKPKRHLSFYFKKYAAKILKAPFFVLPSAAKEKALHKLRQTKLWKSLGSSDYSKLSGVMRETFVKTVTEYLEPYLPEIPHEVLLLWGKDDETTPIYQATRMEMGIRNAVLVKIEHAGHYAFLERPKHFVNVARAFFEG